MVVGPGCAQAPVPGDLASFCSLLEAGVGLSADTSTEGDFARLALVATPEIRPTIESLQDRARDFGELLNDDPPDLQALFLAKFDRSAETERAELDRFTEQACGFEVDRPPATRWSSYVRSNHPNALWSDNVDTQFEVDTTGRIASVTLVFAEAPERMDQVEQACDAATGFLIADGATVGERTESSLVRVMLGSVVVLEQQGTDGDCQLR